MLVLSDMENKSPLPVKEPLFFSKSLSLSLISQWRIICGAQEISFRVEKKGFIFYTLFITITSPFRALYFVFIWLFFCCLLSCSFSVYNILFWIGTFYSTGSCLQVPEPTKQQCWVVWEPCGVTWGAERGRISVFFTHDWNSSLSQQFSLLRIALSLSLKD